MPVHNDGTVTVCCLDSWRTTNMGNVFESSVKDVWHGERFEEVRRLHEEGRWDEVPVCKTCNGWVQFLYEEEVRDGLLIRRSPEFTYYNRIDRLENWSGQLRDGHEPTPRAAGIRRENRWFLNPKARQNRTRFAALRLSGPS